MSPVEFLELNGGLIVRTDALVLALDLERRGHVLHVTDGKLQISRGSKLTADDQARIRALRLHLMAIATYEAPA